MNARASLASADNPRLSTELHEGVGVAEVEVAKQPWRRSTRSARRRCSCRMWCRGSGPSSCGRLDERCAGVGHADVPRRTRPDDGRELLPGAGRGDARRRGRQVIVHTPCQGVKLPRKVKSSTTIVPITAEQVLALAEAMPARLSTLSDRPAGLGLRQSEACGLSKSQIDFLRRSVTRSQCTAAAKVGLPEVTPHDLRHHAASLLIAPGVLREGRSALLGACHCVRDAGHVRPSVGG